MKTAVNFFVIEMVHKCLNKPEREFPDFSVPGSLRALFFPPSFSVALLHE